MTGVQTCALPIWAIQVNGNQVIDQRTFPVAPDQVISFGQDGDGELFVLVQGGSVLKLIPG